MKKFYIFLTVIFAITAFTSGCDNSKEDDSPYSFKIISAGGNFTGYYFADNDTPIYLEGALMSGSSSTYIFEAPMDPDESLTISADGAVGGATSITIYLFKKGSKIETVTATPTVSGGAVSALLEYSLSE